MEAVGDPGLQMALLLRALPPVIWTAHSGKDSRVTDEQNELALRAIEEAARTLGVDPFRLARFLSNGVIADLLQALGSGQAGREDVGVIAEKFQAFLQQERRSDPVPNGGAANGA